MSILSFTRIWYQCISACFVSNLRELISSRYWDMACSIMAYVYLAQKLFFTKWLMSIGHFVKHFWSRVCFKLSFTKWPMCNQAALSPTMIPFGWVNEVFAPFLVYACILLKPQNWFHTSSSVDCWQELKWNISEHFNIKIHHSLYNGKKIYFLTTKKTCKLLKLYIFPLFACQGFVGYVFWPYFNHISKIIVNLSISLELKSMSIIEIIPTF